MGPHDYFLMVRLICLLLFLSFDGGGFFFGGGVNCSSDNIVIETEDINSPPSSSSSSSSSFSPFPKSPSQLSSFKIVNKDDTIHQKNHEPLQHDYDDPQQLKWGRVRQCPLGTVVTGFKFEFKEVQPLNPDNGGGIQNEGGIQGVALQCSKLNYWNNFVPVKIIFDGLVSTRLPWTYETNSHAVGFAFEKWTQFGTGRNYSGNWKFRFDAERLPVSFPPNSFNRVRQEVGCPDGHAIGGFSVQRDQLLDRIHRFRFNCAYHCVPQEVSLVVYDFSNNGITDVHHTVTKRIGLGGGHNEEQSGKFEKTKTANPGFTGELSQQTMLTRPSGEGSRNRGLKFFNEKIQNEKKKYSSSSDGPSPPPPLWSKASKSSKTKNFLPYPPATILQILLKKKGKRMTDTGKSDKNLEKNTKSTMPVGPPGTTNFIMDLREPRQSPPSGAPPSGGAPSGGPPAVPGGSGGGSPPAGGGAPPPPPPGGTSGGAAAPAGSPSGGSGSANYNLKALFEAKFGKSKTTGFNWHTVSYTSWSYGTEETDTLVCKALHRCVLKQLTGQCGIYQFHTPQFDFTHIPLRLDYFDYPLGPGQSPGGGVGGGDGAGSLGLAAATRSGSSIMSDDDDLKIERPGEIWVILKKLTFAIRRKIWSKPKSCPPGSVVTAQQIKSKPGLVFTGLSLECSKLNSSSKFEHVTTMSVGSGMSKKWYNSTTQAIGGSFVQYRLDGSNWKKNFEIRFQGEEDNGGEDGGGVPIGAQNVVRTEAMCPAKHAVCGMMAMFDMDQREMTDFAMQCCHFCDPQEKIIVLESFTNLGYTDTIQTVTRIVGNGMNKGENHSGNNLTENANVMDGINPAGLQAGFSAKFDKKVDTGFNWGTTSTSFWTNHEEKTLTVLCKARMRCVYRQLVGVCNDIEIPTAYFIKESFPLLDNNNNLQTSGQKEDNDQLFGKSRQLRIKRQGENWMVAQNLTFSPPNETWQEPQLCPKGTVVTGQKLKRSPSGLLFAGLSLRCSRLDENGNFETVSELTSGKGNGTSWYDSNSPAIGFTFIQYELNGTSWKAKWEVRFEKDVPYHSVPKGAKNVSRTLVQCPPNNVITGMMAMYDAGDKGQLTNMGFKCSYYCRPHVNMAILNAFTNQGDTDTSQLVKFTIGTRHGQQQHRFDKEEKTRRRTSSNPFYQPHDDLTFSSGMIMMSPLELQDIFSTTFDSKSSKIANKPDGFDWTQTSRSLWTTEEEKMMRLPCKARHSCQFKQMIGYCGHFEILTPYTYQKTVPIDFTESSPATTTPAQSLRPVNGEMENNLKPTNTINPATSFRNEEETKDGEIWLMLKNLTASKPTDQWEHPQSCPPGSFVTAYIVNQTPQSRLGGFILRCSKFRIDRSRSRSSSSRGEDEPQKFETVSILVGGKGRVVVGGSRINFSPHQKWIGGKSPSIGFTYTDFEMMGSILRAHWTLKFESDDDEENWPKLPDGAQNVGRTQVTCPITQRREGSSGFAVCGQQSMFDREGRGVLTGLVLKCCYFCQAQEKLVTLDLFKNSGTTDTIQQVKLTVGTVRTDYNNRTNYINPVDIQAHFSNFLGQSDRFDWTSTSLSLFTNDEVTMTTYHCPSRHLCSFSQLIGVCGEVEVRSPYTVKNSVPLLLMTPSLSLPSSSSTIDNDPTVSNLKVGSVTKNKFLSINKRRNEIWIVSSDLTSSSSSSSIKSGVWGRPQMCPPGSFVTSEKFKMIPHLGLTGLTLQCSRMNEKGEFVPLTKLSSGSSGSSESQWFDGQAPATGFTYTEYKINGSILRAHWTVTFEGDTGGHRLTLNVPEGSWETIVESEGSCPHNHVICGFRTMFDKWRKGLLTSIGFRCCYHCQAEERLVTLDLMTNMGNLDINQSVHWVIGTRVQSGSKILSSRHGDDDSGEEESSIISITPAALRAAFAFRFPPSSKDSKKFSWAETPTSLFTFGGGGEEKEEEVKRTEYICPARHLCTFKQWTGFCGSDVEVLTPYIVKESYALGG